MKDEINYEVQYYDERIGCWYTFRGIKSKKEARLFIRGYKDFDKQKGLKINYQIVKLTIKREIVK